MMERVMDYDWLTDEDERRYYASTVHGLRSRGWSKSDAECEALDRLLNFRDRRKCESSLTHPA